MQNEASLYNFIIVLGILQDNKTVEIYTLDGKYEPNLGILALKLIPANILFIHLFIVIFHKFFLFLFRQIKDLCCHKNQARTISLRLDANIESKNYIMNEDSRQKQNQTFKNYSEDDAKIIDIINNMYKNDKTGAARLENLRAC